MKDKLTGSFYTPRSLVKYMCEYAISKKRVKNILEPSVGDGRFLDELTLFSNNHIDAVEIDKDKVNSIGEKENVDLFCANFIDYALKINKRYDLIIGNPPYISKKNLESTDREKSLELMHYWSLPESIFQNTWVSFVLGALKLLEPENGTLFFVLPFEFLQVYYAEKLRNFLEEKFNVIEITTFKESVFLGIEQDVCLVYMTNNKEGTPIVKYTNVKNAKDFLPIEQSEIKKNKPLKKWSNAILNDDEIALLSNLSNKFLKVSELGHISPGIVTGANDFFILSDEQSELLKSQKYTVPILQKSADIPNLLRINKSELKTHSKNRKMLNLNNIDIIEFPNELQEYLSTGIEKEINERFKCKQRKRWFDVPIIPYGDLMFFKRYYLLPKLLVNNANLFTTDIAYNIRLDDKYDASSVAFSFYNSLTLTLCEFNGRFYGGGVGELVPSEFKSLSIPYKKIESNNIITLDAMFRRKEKMENIISFVDDTVLADLQNEEIEKLKNIRNKYLLRRLKTQYKQV